MPINASCDHLGICDGYAGMIPSNTVFWGIHHMLSWHIAKIEKGGNMYRILSGRKLQSSLH